MKYEIVTEEIKEEEPTLKIRLVDVNGCPTIEGFANGKWYWIGWFSRDGGLGLSSDAQNIPGLQIDKKGRIVTF